MKFEIKNDAIYIYSKEEFNPKHIIECGQVFSYYKKNDKSYIVLSKDQMATVTEFDEYIKIETSNLEYFANYFDLNTNYTKIKDYLLENFPYLNKAINYGSGIRILKQDYFETIISFIISSNNNIKRIQKILFAIREKFGKNMGEYNSFPTCKELSVATEEDFKNLGAGYRAKYLVKACQQILNLNLKKLENLNTQELTNILLKIEGVGPKVADCILLFAYGKQDVFPVDTWIEKVYCSYFNEEHNRVLIRKNLVNTFKDYSGYAQQYLFYSQREL